MRSLGLAIVLLCMLTVSAAPADVRSPGECTRGAFPASARAALERKGGERLLRQLEDAGPTDLVTVWIFFADHGAVDGASISAPEGCMSRRAVNRRRLRAEFLVDSRDLPVSAAYVDSLRGRVARVRHESRYFNAVSAEVEAREIPAICSFGFVERVERVAGYRRPTYPDEIGGEASWPSSGPVPTPPDRYGESFYQLNQAGIIELLEKGYNGSGNVSGNLPVLIAILDTGFKLEHDALRSVHVDAQWDFIQGDTVVSNEEGDSPSQEMHGTTVLGVLAGHEPGNLIGPAWGASFILAKTEIVDQEQPVEEDLWVAGIEWADRLGADVVTSSLGYIDWYTQDQLDGNTALCTIAADIAVSHGIVVVNSAGNQGGAGLVAPADGDSVLAVGAVDRYGAIAPFSSRGPTADGRIKPDFVAMGWGVHSVSYTDSATYATYNGTSFAAPIVAGLAALLLEMHPDWNPMQLREALRATSSRSGNPDNAYGYGTPHAALASQYPESFSIPGAFPNPFSVETNMQFSSTRRGRVTARVYDCRGALVKILADGTVRESRWTLSWDGTNEWGDKVASGVYFVHVASPTFDTKIKVVHIR